MIYDTIINIILGNLDYDSVYRTFSSKFSGDIESVDAACRMILCVLTDKTSRPFKLPLNHGLRPVSIVDRTDLEQAFTDYGIAFAYECEYNRNTNSSFESLILTNISVNYDT